MRSLILLTLAPWLVGALPATAAAATTVADTVPAAASVSEPIPADYVAARVREILAENDSAAWQEFVAAVDTDPATESDVSTPAGLFAEPTSRDVTNRSDGVGIERFLPSASTTRIVLWLSLSAAASLFILPRVRQGRSSAESPTHAAPTSATSANTRLLRARALAVRGRAPAEIAMETRIPRDVVNLVMRTGG